MQNAASSRNRTSQQFGFQPITHHSQIQQSTRTDPSTLHLGGHMGSATTPTNGAQHGEGAPVLSNHDDMGPNISKKSLPANGKKTKGRVKIKMEFIDNKLRRYTTFSKRKTGIMKKAYELSTLTGTQVMLLVASETGHVYTFATRKLQPMITSEAGKALIQTCLNSPDPPPGPGGSSGLDQRMSATGFEETDLTYSVGDDCEKLPDGMGEKGLVYSLEPSPPSGDASPSHHGLHLSMKSPPSSPAAASSSSASCSPSHQMVSNLSSSAILQQPSSSSQLSNANPTTGFATILATAPTGSSLSPSVQISTFHPASTETTSSGGQTPQVYRIPAQGSGGQAFSLAISGPSKSSSNNSSTSTQSQIMPNTSHQNLSLVSGNVVIPAGQTILQTGSTNGAFMYHTGQGLVYATPTTLSEGGVILNIGQEQGGTPQQFITIPVSLSLTPAQQQQLMHVSPTALAATCQVTGCSPAKSHKSRK